MRIIYSTDDDVKKLAVGEGITVMALHNLPLPPPKTGSLFEEKEDAEGKESE